MSDPSDERLGVKPDSDSPEWWAMGREFCVCGHEWDEHVATTSDTRTCWHADCACENFRPLDDKQ